ncbi:Uu.00g131100.m01.CDS01 [Anthostomella pinea]|uniref:Uu.00g131100.m01.CDS01 n=1 Tax=Anthostomella pinea TaxID=933095 RepID=A0AAI8YI90_9PEZI|nr:Uu.00g131100.m01.CDS01 [Anthostomella pinea]
MSSTGHKQLPSTYKGLLFTSASVQPEVTSIPTPQVDVGSIIVRPLYSWVAAYADEIYTNGNPRGMNLQFPIVGGANAIGRVAAVPADAASLKVGDLVTIEPLIRARDDPESKFLLAMLSGFTSGAQKMSADVYHHGTWAELVKVPLENVHRFDEAALQRQGVTPRDLGFFGQLAVPYGGLRDVNLTAGETVLITAATGNFGGGAVHVALAMGASVIAMGRNEAILSELKKLAPGRVETVQLSGSFESDVAALEKFGPVDVFLDFTPPQATNTDHIRAGIMSVRHGGRVSLMGGIQELTVPYILIMLKGLTLKGTMMYTRAQAQDLIKMIETGVLKLGEKAGLKVKGVFSLRDGEKAIEVAGKEAGAGRAVFIAPNDE